MIPAPRRALLAFLALLLLLLGLHQLRFDGWVTQEGDRLTAVAAAAVAALSVDGQQPLSPSADLEQVRATLRMSAERHGHNERIQLLRPQGEGALLVASTRQTAAPRAELSLNATQRLALSQGTREHTGLLRDRRGAWMAGYAPLRDGDGQAVALVTVDRPSGDLLARLWRGRLLSALLSGLLVGLGLLARMSIQQQSGPLASLRRALTGRLTVRIGAAAAMPVLLAVGLITGLQYQQGMAEASLNTRDRMLRIVQVAAPRIDPQLHAELVATGDVGSPAFEALRRELRSIHEQAGLDSTLYTLRQDGQATRFVAMNSEVPFLGDLYELRPELSQTFNDGAARVIGPYTDAHGTWISAWAPIYDPGGAQVASVLQADTEVSALMAEVANVVLTDLVLALVGVILALLLGGWLARGIARPIRHIADAAQRIERGDLAARVPEGRADEVGQLSEAINRMAEGLEEKARLRDMFGKYMAVEVVRDLMDSEELSLTGQLREVSVLLTDIRGFTALTEELGATEVVALLNEYFGILVDAVLESDGVIDKFMGDALLAWFGAPVPMEDHEARAVRAAERIMLRTEQWNQARISAGLKPVRTGIGIARGAVVVGNIGSERRFEYTAIGDAVNLASRLCGKARAGELLVTREIERRSQEPGFEDAGLMLVKGVSEPVSVFRKVWAQAGAMDG